MECPKCGSESVLINIGKRDLGVQITDDYCDNCKKTISDIKQYRQRLYSVLEKFDISPTGSCVYSKLLDDEGYEILYYYKDKFRLYRDNHIISLDTVEHLIADMSDDNV